MASRANFRIVCVREIQNSIKDSVKQLIEDKIAQLGLAAFFTITDQEIRGRNGSLCIFRGLQNHTAASIKSLEGFDVAWIEEAQTISQMSLDLLTPTIRKDGSEIWASWNPVSESDPIDAMLRGGERENAVVVKANWNDNPYFPEALRDDMDRDRERNPDKYAHVWEGKYQSLSEARIFRNWRVGEITVPDRVIWYGGVDFGFANDPTAALRCCMPDARTLYVDHEAFEVGVPTDALPVFLARVPELHKWPCNADSARPETIDYLNRHGFPRMRGARKGKGSVEDGISFLQGLDLVIHPRCVNLTRELSSYAYQIDKRTGQILPVPEDANNHGCIAEGQRILTARGLVPIEAVKIGDLVQTRRGLRRVIDAGVTGRNMNVLEIKTTTGTIVCTPDHRVWTAKGFVRADTLRYNDEIIGDVSWPKKPIGTERLITAGRKLSSIRIGHISGAVSKVALSICTALFGKASTARYQTGCKSIIGTETLRTMTFPIWSVSAQASTERVTNGMKKHGQGVCRISTTSDLWLRHGIELKKDWPFIGNLERLRGLALSHLKNPATIAARHSCRAILATWTFIVPMLANQQRGGRLALITKRALASTVALTSRLTDTPKHKPVVGRVQTVSALGKAERVYDLTIEDAHEFFAENVLVHNCDALRYATERLHRKGKLIPVDHAPEPDRLEAPRDYRPHNADVEDWKTV